MISGNLQKIADALHVLKSDIDPSISKSLLQKLIPVIKSVSEEGLLSEENIISHIYYPLSGSKQPDYAFRMPDESMRHHGIEFGDIVYMRYAQWADANSQMVLAAINKESQESKDWGMKRMTWTEGSTNIQLKAGNDDVIQVPPNQVRVCGIYMGHLDLAKGR